MQNCLMNNSISFIYHSLIQRKSQLERNTSVNSTPLWLSCFPNSWNVCCENNFSCFIVSNSRKKVCKFRKQTSFLPSSHSKAQVYFLLCNVNKRRFKSCLMRFQLQKYRTRKTIDAFKVSFFWLVSFRCKIRKKIWKLSSKVLYFLSWKDL